MTDDARVPVTDADVAAAARLFAAAIEHMHEGYDWDGYDLQQACQKAGLTFERPYDPATDAEIDAEDGDTVWVPTESGLRLLAIARSAAIRQMGGE